MENVKKCFIEFLALHDPGFQIESWAESSGWHRCIDSEGKDHYRFRIFDENSFVFMDMRDGTKEIVSIDNIEAAASIVANKLHIQPTVDKEKIFNENYEKLLKNPISDKPFKIWEEKGLKPFNTITLNQYGRQVLLIPYTDIDSGKVVGCQRRFDASSDIKMNSVKGTQKGNSIHIIQESDQVDPGLNLSLIHI